MLRAKERRIVFNSIVASVVIGIFLFTLLISFAPDSTPYSVSNYGWNGLHNVNTQYSIQTVSALSKTPVSNESVLLIIAPTSGFSSSDASFLKEFVQFGGSLVIADSYGASDSLMSQMGLGIQIGNNLLIDPTFNWQSASYPVALVNNEYWKVFPVLSNVSGIALTEPRPLAITSPLVSVVGMSSAQSIEVSSGQSLGINISSIVGTRGPFPLVAFERLGRGFVMVVGDSSMFTNSVWSVGQNRVLIANLLSNREVYLDTSHWPLNTATSLRAEFILGYTLLSTVPFRYLLTLAFIGSAVLLIRAISGVSTIRQSRIGSVSRFNNGTLIRVRSDREKYGVQHE